MTRSLLVVALLVLVSGCMVGQRTTAPDADADGLPDEIELGGWNVTVVKTVFVCFATEPPERLTDTRFVHSNELRTDTDGDGVTDFEEHFFRGDPENNDTDGDGLLDGDEWELRSDESLFTPTRLAMNQADSDEDCLPDGEEIDGYEIPGLGHRVTDPTAADSDEDGFPDAWEIQKSHSDPLNPDTDGDGSVDRHDLDPLHDVWMRIRFTALTAKDLPSNSARVGLFWTVPAKAAAEVSGSSGPIEVTEGQPVTLEDAHSPGEVDVDDQRGGSVLIFEFYARILDAENRPVEVLDINPHNPGRAVEVRYDVATDQWEFRTPNGHTAPGTSTSLETAEARLTFTFEDFAADPD